jgi:hypothetical protein
MNRRIAGAAIGVVAVMALVLTGCAGARAEHQGKQVGKAICDLKGADSKEEAQKQLKKINEDFSDALRITGMDVNQDVRSVDENLNDLAEHAAQGNSSLLQQDLAVIRRNLSQAIHDTNDNVQHYYQGVREGLDDCYDH